MDYIGILKKAAITTWRHKILWLFGFFVGTWGGSQGLNYSTNSSDRSDWDRSMNEWPELQREFESARESVQRFVDSGDWVRVAIIVGAVILVVGIIMFVLRVAAQGGIIHLAEEALAERPTRGMDGWRVGFANWGGVFAVALVLLVPVLLVLMVMAVVGVYALYWILVEGRTLADSATALGGAAVLAGVLAIALVPVGIVLSIMREIAWRRVVIEGAAAGEAISQSWQDLWGRRGAWVMWLVQLVAGIALGIVFGIVMVILSAIVIIPTLLAYLSSSQEVGFWVAIAIVVGLILAIPAAIISSAFSAFQAVAWSEFYDRMTGRTATT